MEKSVGKNETYYTASTGHPFALGTAPDHINSHRQTWNTWKHWFQRVPESKWNRAKTTINHQKLSEKCLLTSLFTAAQILNPSHGHWRTLILLVVVRFVPHGNFLLPDSPHELALHMTTCRIGRRKRLQKNVAHVVEEPYSTEKDRRVTLPMVQEELCIAVALSGRLRQPVFRCALILSYFLQKAFPWHTDRQSWILILPVYLKRLYEYAPFWYIVHNTIRAAQC